MTHVVSKVWDLFRGHSNFARRVSGGILGGSNVQLPAVPDAPTLDAADQARLNAADQLQRRKGVLANIFAGNSQQNSSVGKTTLGG